MHFCEILNKSLALKTNTDMRVEPHTRRKGGAARNIT